MEQAGDRAKMEIDREVEGRAEKREKRKRRKKYRR